MGVELATAFEKNRPILVGVGVAVALLMAPTLYKPPVLVVGAIILAFDWLHRNGIWQRLAIAWLVRLGRLPRHGARLFRTSLLAETLWLIAGVSVAVCAGTLRVYPSFASLAGSFGAYAFAMGGAIQWGGIGLRLGQRAWVRAAGKVAIGVAAAVLVCVARSAASDFVAGVVHVDPNAFPLFLDLATALITPCLGLAVVAALTMVLTAPMFGVALLLQTGPGQWLLTKIRMISVLHARRQRYFTVLPTPFGVSTISGFFAAALVVAWPVDSLRDNRDLFARYATNILVYADFRPKVVCDGVADGDLVAFIGQGQVVVARPADNQQWSFREQTCRASSSLVGASSAHLAVEIMP